MIRIELPAPQSPAVPAFSVVALLDGVSYALAFRFHEADGQWRMRVLDEAGQTVLHGDVVLTPDWPLYRALVVRTPPCLLVLRDTAGQGAPCGLGDLGERHRLYYVPAAELG